ncbi:type II toxin-antitoxin system VapC family toxin [Paramicrobacterium agarici]|uniref:Ribonuclease VapC n=1 Tax=Paramicrobacterium agarici TaxID=630514 RepID=A0A2A9DVP8_9MICO|nr:type II toxin-antitoxin system VapC family toxin [Microbacterium agarici]PFG29989.1 hypothetical protein ATJ78_0909 [Microbacterium agarici]TQO22993.1 hypothetical protein FB385_1836 [Microbacterium agarici]
MIIVDTNVWSESLRPQPDQAVLAWLREQHREAHLAVTTVHELQFGVLNMPEGARKESLERAVSRMLVQLAPRVISYDYAAAIAHAELRHHARETGRAISSEDGQILAIAALNGASIATRNVRDFDGFGVPIVNPWEAS